MTASATPTPTPTPAAERSPTADAPLGEALRPTMRYQPAFDGLRGIGILAVIAGHTAYREFGSAFYAVDWFFVLSGFLITTLLLEEWFGTGGVSLRLFWQRRAARLLPALLLACAALALVAGLDAIHSLRPVLNPFPADTTMVGVLVSLGYMGSWTQALFHTELGPLAHTWSLSVEEWFYLLWPLALLPLLRRPRILTRVLLGVALAAIVYRLVSEEIIPSRFYLYFSPDQRVCQLMAGCALAAVLYRYGGRLLEHRRAVAVAGWLGALVAAVMICRPISAAAVHSSVPYERDGVVVVALAMAACIGAMALLPGLWFARALSLAPLLWIGKRSYGLYLYHYPITLIVSPYSGPEGRVPWRLFLVSLVLMFAAAAASYRWVEQPVLRRMRAREARMRASGRARSTRSRQAQDAGRLVPAAEGAT